MSSVVDMVDGEEGGSGPFDGARIEVSEADLRKALFPTVWLGRAKQRLNEYATQFTYGDVQ
ncbi:MAG: hypothetical protein ABEJ05_01560 [Haloglomus sp.]